MKNVIIAAVVLLAGCANTNNPAAVAKATTTLHDPYTRQTFVTGDLVKERNYLGFSKLLYRLEAEIRNGNEPNIRLYVGSNSAEHGFLYSASDIDATVLPVAQVNTELTANARADENVALTLSRPYLESHKTSGLDIRIGGNRGALIVKVPGPYIAGFLAKLDDVKTQSDKCGGQVNSDAETGFFTGIFHSMAKDGKLPNTECSR